MHHSIWKILFALGADEYLDRLKGKIRKQGAQYELTNIFLFFEIYNVNYKGEVTSLYVGCSKKSNSRLSVLLRISETVTSSWWRYFTRQGNSNQLKFKAADYILNQLC